MERSGKNTTRSRSKSWNCKSCYGFSKSSSKFSSSSCSGFCKSSSESCSGCCCNLDQKWTPTTYTCSDLLSSEVCSDTISTSFSSSLAACIPRSFRFRSKCGFRVLKAKSYSKKTPAAPGQRGKSCSPGATPVFLNVYDLTPVNGYVYWAGLGIFHSGVEVHGLEYAFGAHDYSTSGVFEVEPRQCPGFTFRKSIYIGTTHLDASELREFIECLADNYNGDTYHLIAKNCNHFCTDICLKLTGKSIPAWVNRLARIGSVCNCLLPKSLHVSAVRHEPSSCHSYAEKKMLRSSGSGSGSGSGSFCWLPGSVSGRKAGMLLPQSPFRSVLPWEPKSTSSTPIKDR